jgi:hypothetical protein
LAFDDSHVLFLWYAFSMAWMGRLHKPPCDSLPSGTWRPGRVVRLYYLPDLFFYIAENLCE